MSAQVGTGRYVSAQVGTCRHRSVHVGTGRYMTAQVGQGRHRSAHEAGGGGPLYQHYIAATETDHCRNVISDLKNVVMRRRPQGIISHSWGGSIGDRSVSWSRGFYKV